MLEGPIAALFEPDKNKISVRIDDAERKIAARAGELFDSGDHSMGRGLN
jgi:hypothetical protein